MTAFIHLNCKMSFIIKKSKILLEGCMLPITTTACKLRQMQVNPFNLLFTCCVRSCVMRAMVFYFVGGCTSLLWCLKEVISSHTSDFVKWFVILQDERWYLNVNYSTSTTIESQSLWNWCCSTGNLEKWFFYSHSFKILEGFLKETELF